MSATRLKSSYASSATGADTLVAVAAGAQEQVALFAWLELGEAVEAFAVGFGGEDLGELDVGEVDGARPVGAAKGCPFGPRMATTVPGSLAASADA